MIIDKYPKISVRRFLKEYSIVIFFNTIIAFCKNDKSGIWLIGA